jgi:hypothetical protein
MSARSALPDRGSGGRLNANVQFEARPEWPLLAHCGPYTNPLDAAENGCRGLARQARRGRQEEPFSTLAVFVELVFGELSDGPAVASHTPLTALSVQKKRPAAALDPGLARGRHTPPGRRQGEEDVVARPAEILRAPELVPQSCFTSHMLPHCLRPGRDGVGAGK